LKVAFNLESVRVEHGLRPAVYAELTSQPFAAYSGHFATDQLIPSLVAAAVYFLVNVLLISAVLALANDEPLGLGRRSSARRDLHDNDVAVCGSGGRVVVAVLGPDRPLCLLPIAAVRRALALQRATSRRCTTR
jgi:hypothetical protein